LFTCVKSKAQRLIARNCRFRFKLKFKADRVQLKMVQRTIVENQFTMAYLIEFTVEPLSCNRPLVCKQAPNKTTQLSTTSLHLLLPQLTSLSALQDLTTASWPHTDSMARH